MFRISPNKSWISEKKYTKEKTWVNFDFGLKFYQQSENELKRKKIQREVFVSCEMRGRRRERNRENEKWKIKVKE